MATPAPPILPDAPPANLSAAGPPGPLYDPLQLIRLDGAIGTRVLLVAGTANTDAAVELTASEDLAVIGLPDEQPLLAASVTALLEAGVEVFILWWPPSGTHGRQSLDQAAAVIGQHGAPARAVESGSPTAVDLQAVIGGDFERAAEIAHDIVERSVQIGATGAASGDWPAVARPDLPPFPLEALPPKMALAAEAIANETQTPVDLAAVAMLCVLSAASLGATVDVNGSSWEEELCLYALVALPTGEHKSSVLKLVAKALREIERRVQENAMDEVNRARARRESLTERQKQLVKKIGTSDDADARNELETEHEQVVAELDQIGPTEPPRLLADNVTAEALGGLLATHQRMAIIAGEGTFLENTLGRYDAKGSANLGTVCSAYGGEPIIVDRRRGSERVDRPLLTIFIAAQEHVLRDLVENQTAKSQGVVNRFAYCVPRSLQGGREMRPHRAPAELLAAWSEMVDHVHDVISVIPSREVRLELSAGARDALDAYREAQEPRLREDGDLRPIADLVTRDPGRAVRIAGLLHLVEHTPAAPISRETMERGLRVAGYFLAHGAAAVTQPDPAVRRARSWLARRDTTTVTQRDLHRGPFQRLKRDEVRTLVEELCNLGDLRPIAEPSSPRAPGAPPSPTYLINPHLATGPTS